MAEFVEVMKQMKRMCESIKAGYGCEKCPFDDDWCGEYGLSIDYDTAQRVEDDVMSWAAKHPEPKKVYPTFAEWQRENFKIKGRVLATMQPCAFMVMGCPDVPECSKCAEQTRIPEDVATKLGIEPKLEDEK